jgi:hypothetical protein
MKKINLTEWTINRFFSNSFSFFSGILAIIMLIEILTLVIDKNFFFSESSIIPWQLGLVKSEYYWVLYKFYNFLISMGVSIYIFYDTVIILYIVLIVLSLIKIKPIWVYLLLILSNFIIFRTIPLFNYGYDHFVLMSIFYCLVIMLFSRKYKDDKFSISILLKYHLMIIYFTSGMSKAFDLNWWNGNAIWRAIATPTFDIFIPPILLLILSAGTVIIELLYPLLIHTKYRKITIIHIILLHIGIGIFLGLSSFAAIMILWNLTAFYKDFNFVKTLKNNEVVA